MINTRINEIRQTHEEKAFIGVEEKDGLSLKDLITCVNELIESGLSSELIKMRYFQILDLRESSLPQEVIQLLK
ncbi:MAG: hypothetical protein IPO23_13315 [Flavobacterium sp.]|nr:hypothetical protein [Flavobacterium sp.]